MNSKKIIIIAAAALLVIVIAVVAVVLLTGKKDTMAPPKAKETVKSSGEQYYFTTGELYCNIKDSKTAILSISVVVVTDADELVKRIEKAPAVINDAVNKIVRSHTLEELQDTESFELLKQEIFDELSEVYQTKNISEILFEKFVIQL